VLAQSRENAAHFIGEQLPFVRTLGCDDVAFVGSNLGFAHVSDPLAHEAPEGSYALVFHSIFGNRLRVGEDALELGTGLLVRSKESLVAREQVTTLSCLEVDHEPEQLFGVVREFEVVLHKPLKLPLELFVRRICACEPNAEHGHDQERA
jgi:hypothetical protein